MGPAVALLVGALLIPGVERIRAPAVEKSAVTTREGKYVSDPWLAGLGPDHVRGLPTPDFWGGGSGSFCGVYCLYLGARLTGRAPPSPARLAALSGTNAGVSTMSGLCSAARALGFVAARPFRVVPGDLQRLPYPVIAHRRASLGCEGHFVLLTRQRHGLVQVVDFPRYVAWVPMNRLERFDDLWRGDVLLLEPYRRPATPIQVGLVSASIVWALAAAWRLASGAGTHDQAATESRGAFVLREPAGPP